MIIEHLTESLFMAEHDSIDFALTSPHRYKVYEIPKRNSNKTRTIAHPAKELKFIQRHLAEFLKDKLPVHEAAYAYRNGLGIKDNAFQHLNSKYLLKMDFENFFQSITPSLFFTVAKKKGIVFDKHDKLLLTGLLFWKPKDKNGLVLSIGAPTSPLISNFIMYYFDEKISAECKNKKITYTRYADDITFSTKIKNNLFYLPVFITECLNKQTFGNIKLNEVKTVFTSKAHNRHVTGVTLTNDSGLSIGREKKRLISSMIHKSTLNQLTNEEAARLQGLISYAAHIEPSFRVRMIKKYGIDALNNIKFRASGS